MFGMPQGPLQPSPTMQVDAQDPWQTLRDLARKKPPQPGSGRMPNMTSPYTASVMQLLNPNGNQY